MAENEDFAVVPSSLDEEIQGAIKTYGQSDLMQLDASYGNYAVKYVSAKYAKQTAFYISTTPGFTWGTATYVAHFENPVSSAIFGRAGLVATYDATGWRTFDARNGRSERLYLQWLGFQPFVRNVLLTTHSGYFNQLLRNRFRTHYRIDCVLFNPDQSNPHYTKPDDTWMAVSDFMSDGQLKIGYSDRFKNVRLTVVIAEEFASLDPNVAMTLDALIGPLTPPVDPVVARAHFLSAYQSGKPGYTTL